MIISIDESLINEFNKNYQENLISFIIFKIEGEGEDKVKLSIEKSFSPKDSISKKDLACHLPDDQYRYILICKNGKLKLYNWFPYTAKPSNKSVYMRNISVLKSKFPISKDKLIISKAIISGNKK